MHLSAGSEPPLSETSYPPWDNNEANILVALRNRLSNNDEIDSDDDDDPYQSEVESTSKKSKVISFTMSGCVHHNHNVQSTIPNPLMPPIRSNDDDEVTL